MPELGEIKRGKDISQASVGKYVWAACQSCGRERWVQYVVRKARPKYSLCHLCSTREANQPGKLNPNWTGGRIKNGKGYMAVWVSPDDFFYPMINRKSYILEHRLVVAQHLGRCLQSWEIVHHKNHIRDDNRIENLQLISDDRHKQLTILENRIKALEKRITVLEAENTLLRTEQEVCYG